MRLLSQLVSLLVLQAAARAPSKVQAASDGEKPRHKDVVEGTAQGLAHSLVELSEVEGEGEEGETGQIRSAEEGETGEMSELAEPAEGEGEEGIAGEEGVEGEEGEEEGEEETEFTMVDIQVACMLLGGVAFVITLFILVNWPDDDIRRYAWVLISSVTSIFVAVLIFSSVNEWVLSYAEEYELKQTVLCAIQYGHLFVWVCILQFVLAATSGSILEGDKNAKGCLYDEKVADLTANKWVFADALRADFEEVIQDDKFVRTKERNGQPTTRSVYQDSNDPKYASEVPCVKCYPNQDRRKRRMKCWGTLLAHMCGFAAINAGNTMAHLEVFSGSPVLSLIPVLINQSFIALLFNIFKCLRKMLHQSAKAKGGAGIRAAMFNEEVMESENDISCLAGSYLIISSLRYALVGELPSMVGEIEGETPWNSVWILYAAGFFLLLTSVLLIVIKAMTKKEGAKGEEEEEEESMAQRVLTVITGMCGMAFAWACLYASRTIFEKEPYLQEKLSAGMTTITGRILLALVLSVICLVIIFGLDFIGDTAKKLYPGKNLGNSIIKRIVDAKSILVGFSWEHAFDGGVEAIASTTSDPQFANTAIAVLVFLIIVPAWRRYILKKAIVLQQYAKLQEGFELQEYTRIANPANSQP